MVQWIIDKMLAISGVITQIWVRFLLASNKHVTLKGRLTILGKPLIEVCKGGRLEIGDACCLRSDNRGYHLNLHTPVKLKVSKPGAKIIIGKRSKIYGSAINAFKSITIGNDCLIAANCQIFDANGHEFCWNDLSKRAMSKDEGQGIVIEDFVWIGAGSIILPGIRIGRGSIIGAGSVVTKDIPPMCIAAGNPARMVRRACMDGIHYEGGY